MTSACAELQKPERKGVFTFTWSIHNFSHLWAKEDEVFQSPEFVTKSLKDVRWNLGFYPKGFAIPGFASLFLFLKKDPLSVFSRVSLQFTLSVCDADGQFKEIFNENTFDTELFLVQGCRRFLCLADLLKPSNYLKHDTLTVQCKMWKKDEDCSLPVSCHAHTEINVSKIEYIWTLDDIAVVGDVFDYKFKHTTKVPFGMSNVPNMKIHLLSAGSSGENALHFGVETLDLEEDVFLVCVIHLLDASGRVANTTSAKRFLEVENKTEIFTFPIISKRKLYLDENLYLLNQKLSLRCEFSFSGKAVTERIEYQRSSESTMKPSTPNGHDIFNEALLKFYLEGKRSNVIVSTPNRQFPAHKEFLCAHSEVFCAMFEHDMEEQNSGTINIEDLEDDTVAKMLKFIYTGKVDLKGEDTTAAQKLYYAADKYGIASLLRLCFEHLKNNIDISNVCDVLILSDNHQDNELKYCSKEFIFEHSHEFLATEGWKEIKKYKSELTIELMEWLINNKLKL